ncbi:hypothetical protein HELRODRAFT_67701 [Helobdella robusta]|uniref:UbiA prenyltransferase domain-containing protein 1 n=1 Tax=Helobdella robusta TaxID=6412 RepID=T1FZ42_HELRO|nr:hypothetical protein HELRODRAFT_67701 [Helobdella robusta]ESN96761.1 hypothetical protein HELRODRAFT_67701 [Helobdella robusta]
MVESGSSSHLLESNQTQGGQTNKCIKSQTIHSNGVQNFLVTKIPKSILKKLSPYLIALRLWSLTASLCPVSLGACLYYKYSNKFDIFIFVITSMCALSVHAAGNLVNTYYDYVKGIDSQKKSDDRTLVDHLLSPNDVSTMGAICYIFGCLGFLVLCHISPAPVPHLALLYFGGLSSSFLYTGGLGLKYLALGDLLIFLTFGPLTVLFAYLAQGGPLSLFPMLHAVPIALNTEAILHANNTRDMNSDKEAGIVTLAILIGKTGSYALFVALLFLPYIIFIVLAANYNILFFLPLLTIFLAFPIERSFRAVLTNVDNSITRDLAKLNFLMSLFYIIVCLLSDKSKLPGYNI